MKNNSFEAPHKLITYWQKRFGLKSLLLIAVLLLLLAACGGGEETTSDTPPEPDTTAEEADDDDAEEAEEVEVEEEDKLKVYIASLTEKMQPRLTAPVKGGETVAY